MSEQPYDPTTPRPDPHLHGAVEDAARTPRADDDATVSDDAPSAPTAQPGTGATEGWNSPPGAGDPERR